MEPSLAFPAWLAHSAILLSAMYQVCSAMPVYKECSPAQAERMRCQQRMVCLVHIAYGRRVETFCMDIESFKVFSNAGNPAGRPATRAAAPSTSHPDAVDARQPAEHTTTAAPRQRSTQAPPPPPQLSNGHSRDRRDRTQLSSLQQRHTHPQPVQRLDHGRMLTKSSDQRSRTSPDQSSDLRRPTNRFPPVDQVRDACAACRRYNTTHTSFKRDILTAERICASDFVFKVRAVSSFNNRQSVQVLVVYRLKHLPALSAPNITNIYLENTMHSTLNFVSRPCLCRTIHPGHDYLITGKDDITAKQFTVTREDLVLDWSNRVGRRTLRFVPQCFSSE
eukprot:scpid90359/ scgid0865/ 